MRIDYQLALCQTGLHIGYSAESGWLAAIDEKYWPLEGKDVWKALPLLELEPDEMIGRLSEIYALAPAATPFPLLELLRSAFVFYSSYWAEKAAKWYPYLSDEDKRQLSTALSDIAQGKWATQKLRQFAQREVRKLKP